MNLSPHMQAVANELDGLSLRLFGPLLYHELDPDQRSAVAWESVRELCLTFDPPIALGPRPAGWRIEP